MERKVINELERYKKLLEEGIISEEDFEAKKEELKTKLNETLREE
ncbi:SHOCT domain-containing protein [Fusobacterium canifelinum]